MSGLGFRVLGFGTRSKVLEFGVSIIEHLAQLVVLEVQFQQRRFLRTFQIRYMVFTFHI